MERPTKDVEITGTIAEQDEPGTLRLRDPRPGSLEYVEIPLDRITASDPIPQDQLADAAQVGKSVKVRVAPDAQITWVGPETLLAGEIVQSGDGGPADILEREWIHLPWRSARLFG